METITKTAWVVLAAVHAGPAAVFFTPALAGRLYDVAPTGEAGVLIVHRGALFLALVIGAAAAVVDRSARRAVSLVMAVSVFGYLVTYARAGAPPGALRVVALADALALLPLALVFVSAWRRQSVRA
jgi:hypothetical protein